VLKVEDEALQALLVRAIIDQDLSAERIQRLVESGELETMLSGQDRPEIQPDDGILISERVASRWSSLASQFSKADLTLVAERWVKRQKPEDVRAQVAMLKRLLEIVEKQVDED
jgi:hypothetical protein